MKRKNRTFTKLENHNLKQRFKADFQSGKHSICELARIYNVDRRKLLKWKHELFGKGSVKQKRIFQMHLAGLTAQSIADFFNVPLQQVYRSIRQERQKYSQKPQQSLFKEG